METFFIRVLCVAQKGVYSDTNKTEVWNFGLSQVKMNFPTGRSLRTLFATALQYESATINPFMYKTLWQKVQKFGTRKRAANYATLLTL